MAQIAILAVVQIGLAVASSLMQPRAPKQAPIDRGKQDDLRFTIVEEHAFIPRVYGDWVRLGGNLFWGTPTQEHVTTTAGRSGGKKGRGAEPATNTFSYTKSFAAYCCEGPIRAFLKIKEGDDVIFNQMPATGGAGYYEAEHPENTLAGGAVVATDLLASGGKKVTLGNGASVTFPGLYANTAGVVNVILYFATATSAGVTLRVNDTTDYVVTLDNSAGAFVTVEVPVTLTAGVNTLKITKNSGTTVYLDKIFHFPGLILVDDPPDLRLVTGVVNVDATYPADVADPSAFYNKVAYVDPKGQMSGTIAAGGQAFLEWYLGTETQEASPTIVTAEGATKTPAHRGLAYVVAKDYNIKNGQLGNLTFEVQPLLNDLADVLAAEFKLRGATEAQLDFEAVRGTRVEGLYIDRLAPLTEIVDVLQLFFNFDIVPADAKIRAVPRGGSSVRNIPHHELLAHQEGDDRPRGVRIEHIEASDLPGGVYVAWVNPADSKEFHTSSQFVPLGFGTSLEAETINLPLVVSDPNDIVAFGKRWLFGRHLEKAALSFALSPKHRDLIPTDVVTLELPQKTIDVRLTSTQAALPGLVKAKALPESAGLYNQTGIGEIGTGTENRVVKFPANSFIYIGDIPLRPNEDDRLRWVAAMCPIGRGNWEGGYLYKEMIEASGEYERLLAFPNASTIGILEDDVAGIADTLPIDRASQFVLNLYFEDTPLSSVSENDVLARPVNEIAIGSGDGCEIARFATATPRTPTANVTWTNAVGVSVSGNNLTKTAAEGWGNAGAHSTQSFPSGDGYVEFTATETNTLRIIGLSKGDTNQNFTEIDFAFYLQNGAVLGIYENGTNRGSFGTYATGDVLRIAVEGGVMKYRKNGTLLYTSAVAPSYPLLVDTALYSPAATINSVVLFPSSFVASYVLTNLLRGLYGTEQAALAGHGADTTVVLLNDRVQSYTEDASELRRARNLVGATVGQVLPDAITAGPSVFTFRGYSKKPYAVTGITGDRNAVGDAIGQWARRGRVAASLRSNIGVSLAEERELYLFEVLDSGVPVYQTWIDQSAGIPVPWYDYVDPVLGPDSNTRKRSNLTLDPYRSLFEFTAIIDDGIGGVSAGDIQVLFWDSAYSRFVYKIQCLGNPAGGNIYFSIVEYADNGSVLGSYATYLPEAQNTARPRLQIVNGEALFFDSFVNDGTAPVYKARRRPPEIGTLRVSYYASAMDGPELRNAFASSGKPTAIFPANLQGDLLGGLIPLGQLEVRITQYSALVGPGYSVTAFI